MAVIANRIARCRASGGEAPFAHRRYGRSARYSGGRCASGVRTIIDEGGASGPTSISATRSRRRGRFAAPLELLQLPGGHFAASRGTPLTRCPVSSNNRCGSYSFPPREAGDASSCAYRTS
jgi:hypothetical protein